MSTYYVTTPIYYVNDRPHIGHCYTTLVADVAARFARLFGRDVFMLTGTDEHAEKVVSSAAAHGVTPLQWADRNAKEFQDAFALLNLAPSDFIRTTQRRHTEKVEAYVRRLQEAGHVYMGEYTGWWDGSQEEYLTETAAKEAGFNSPVTGRPLVKRTEKNYFFRLSAFEERLLKHIRENEDFILPESRRNEVLGRLRDGLQDVPVSRAVSDDPASRWGILMPDDKGHRIYVWIDALFNYLSVVDTEARRRYWPPAVHVLAKDILWFHAVVWPCLLMALGEPLPRTVYAHAYWVRDGRKMSKSLGNFVDIDVIREYCTRFGRDALRWFLATQGPLHNTDADFSHAKFVEVYNADLANGIGNAVSRVGNMIVKYFGGHLPDPQGRVALEGHSALGFGWPEVTAQAVRGAIAKADRMDVAGALREGVELVRRVDGYINHTQPFKIAKTIETDPKAKADLGAILYHCAETLRIASLLMAPACPETMAKIWRYWSCDPPENQSLGHMTQWGGEHSLKPGCRIEKGDALFMRIDPADPAPGAAAAAPAGG